MSITVGRNFLELFVAVCPADEKITIPPMLVEQAIERGSVKMRSWTVGLLVGHFQRTMNAHPGFKEAGIDIDDIVINRNDFLDLTPLGILAYTDALERVNAQ